MTKSYNQKFVIDGVVLATKDCLIKYSILEMNLYL